ncbi:hypothetical protein [Beggiatoa leptomitoformis]|uniref:Glycosyltransferase RgtA/B/C/D-like domain-containing protein n=1 Tax=Beggiatoa leptomitoformis TaxID=288004 RepID=A0A2N9YGS5_9GAMM|nr:hypothetical protein [Beggiatoa leptomitoformis]ALG68019.2 hypothetical protein AL038_10255 [Beggiatoa leptomitoformis]AUI69694.2 hypothetical protein BLE401_14025 [Beggiatoa leptomitoformis]
MPAILRSPLVQVCCLITLFCVVWMSGWLPAVTLTFHDDDAHVMRVALSYAWHTFLTNPAAYQELSTAHYMPWVLWSYQIDLWLAGDANPLVFLIHQALSLSILISLISVLAWRVAERYSAGMIALLLLLTHPTLFQLLTENYTRHYVEGGISITLSTLGLLQWWQTARARWWWLCLGFYALAVLAKEIYLIVPLLYFWLPQFSFSWTNIKRISGLMFGYFCVAVAYLFLRQMMLSTVGGGMEGIALLPLLVEVWQGLAQVTQWFVEQNVAVLVAVVCAVVFGKSRFAVVLWLIITLIFLMFPAVFAPHLWRSPSEHAARILLLSYLFLTLFSAVQLAKSPIIHRVSFIYSGIILLFLWGVFVAVQNHTYAQKAENSTNQLIVNALLASPPVYDALVAPKGFVMGELHWTVRYFRGSSPELLWLEQDTIQRLQTGKTVGYIDEGCHCLKRLETTPQQCRVYLPSDAIQAIFRYEPSGQLMWDIQLNGRKGEAGVFFLDRQHVAPLRAFTARVSRARQGEEYRFYFTGDNGECWVSPIQKIVF